MLIIMLSFRHLNDKLYGKVLMYVPMYVPYCPAKQDHPAGRVQNIDSSQY